MAGGPQRDAYGLLVVVPMRDLLTPPGDHEQRVVDRHAQPDEGDEELHDEAHVGEDREEQHDEESREDRDRGDEQRDEREERGEGEHEHGKGAERPEQRLFEDARSTVVAATRGELRVAGQAAGEAVLLELGAERVLDQLLVGVDEPVRLRLVDDAERGPAVTGDEPLVLGLGVVDDAQRRDLSRGVVDRWTSAAEPVMVWPWGTVTTG